MSQIYHMWLYINKWTDQDCVSVNISTIKPNIQQTECHGLCKVRFRSSSRCLNSGSPAGSCSYHCLTDHHRQCPKHLSLFQPHILSDWCGGEYGLAIIILLTRWMSNDVSLMRKKKERTKIHKTAKAVWRSTTQILSMWNFPAFSPS